jgi:hypothetical protein
MSNWTFAQKALLILARFHLATAVVFSIVAAIQIGQDRAARSQPA